MPRTISLVCSGICILLTTALSGQALLPKPTTQRQVSRSVLQQQRAWSHRQLPVNPALYNAQPAYSAGHRFPDRKYLMDLPTSQTPMGISIRPTYSLYPDYSAALEEENSWQLLDLYMARYKVFYPSWPAQPTYIDPEGNIGSILLRSIIEARRSPSRSLHRPPKRP
ncbi:MAG TPA: hypothetical protein VGE66_19935 [Chitinophagaceae bacterium]